MRESECIAKSAVVDSQPKKSEDVCYKPKFLELGIR